MKNKSIPSFFKLSLYLIFFCSIALLFYSCSSTSGMRVSEYKFTYYGQDYLLRSAYCPNNPRSCNQIICKDFVANDLNQDRIIDEVINNDSIPLAKVQKVYDFCLTALERQGKVNKIDVMNNLFTYKENNFTLEIKSFAIDTNNTFNQFTIAENTGPTKIEKSVFVDKKADGTLNEVLKGDFNIQEAQKKYDSIIKKGLAQGTLKKVNNFIICK